VMAITPITKTPMIFIRFMEVLLSECLQVMGKGGSTGDLLKRIPGDCSEIVKM